MGRSGTLLISKRYLMIALHNLFSDDLTVYDLMTVASWPCDELTGSQLFLRNGLDTEVYDLRPANLQYYYYTTEVEQLLDRLPTNGVAPPGGGMQTMCAI